MIEFMNNILGKYGLKFYDYIDFTAEYEPEEDTGDPVRVSEWTAVYCYEVSHVDNLRLVLRGSVETPYKAWGKEELQNAVKPEEKLSYFLRGGWQRLYDYIENELKIPAQESISGFVQRSLAEQRLGWDN